MGLGGLLYTSQASRLIARLGESRLIGLGSVVVALGLCALSACVHLLPSQTVVWAAVGCCVMLGFGFYMLHNTLQVLASQMSAQSRATAVGLFAVSIFLGQAGGVEIAARLTPIMGQGRLIIASGILMALLGSILAWRVSWSPK
jgi:predicted MFS family arabinose efflux permease